MLRKDNSEFFFRDKRSEVGNPKQYNDEVIFPDKVRLNLEYMDNWSLWGDVIIIFRTVFRRSW